jgi:putative zinc finger/helix-turn-helix YgiT family protein
MRIYKEYSKCPECRENSFRRKKGNFITYIYEGKKQKELIVPDVEWDECELCGEKLLDYDATKKISDAKYKAKRLFTPDEIKLIRDQLGLSQMRMAKLLKTGAKTYNRWENGTFMQTQAHKEMLKRLGIEFELPLLIIEDPEIKAIKNELYNKFKITNNQSSVIARKIPNYRKNLEPIEHPFFSTPRLAVFSMEVN